MARCFKADNYFKIKFVANEMQRKYGVGFFEANVVHEIRGPSCALWVVRPQSNALLHILIILFH